MTGFDAGTAVEPMDYDFTTTPGGRGKGTVPEPSTRQMKKFQDEFTRIMRAGTALEKSMEDVSDMSDDALADFQAKQDAISEQLDAAIAGLCQDQPSAAEVATLPFRVKTAFSNWLLEQFRPESAATATKK